jgi:hypothetical protein
MNSIPRGGLTLLRLSALSPSSISRYDGWNKAYWDAIVDAIIASDARIDANTWRACVSRYVRTVSWYVTAA